MHSLALALAGICTDMRKTQVWPCLPEPDVRCQPQVQSATSVYVKQSARQSTANTSAGNSASTAPVSVSTPATAAASSWATSSPFADKNRYDPLCSTTDDDGCMNEQQEPFTTVPPRRQKLHLVAHHLRKKTTQRVNRLS